MPESKEPLKMLTERDGLVMVYNEDMMTLCKSKARLAWLRSKTTIIKPNEQDNNFVQMEQEKFRIEHEILPEVERACRTTRELIIDLEKKVAN